MKIVYKIFTRHKNYIIFSEFSQCSFALFSEYKKVVIIIHEKIKKICKKRKIAIYKLEEDLGFAKGYISKLSKSSPSIDNAMKIARYLGVDVKELV